MGQMQALITWVNVGGKAPVTGTSTSTLPQHNGAYNRGLSTTSSSYESWGMSTNPKILPGAYNPRKLHPHSKPTGGKYSYSNAADPYTPHNVLLDPLVSPLSSTLVTYIAVMVIRQVRQ